VKSFKWQDYWGAIQFANLQQHMLENVVSKNDKMDIQGCGKDKGHVSDVYDDVELPYPDCKVAEKLGFGGLCFYLIDNTADDSTILMTFISTKVVPNICQRLPASACLVLGEAVVSSMDYIVIK
jgi:hypothetical protein